MTLAYACWTPSVPTFYLLPNVQGIVDLDHARRIALAVLGDIDPATLTVTQVWL